METFCRYFLRRIAHKANLSRNISIAVEGNIASGKSSFVQQFEGNPHAKIYPEPVEKWRNINGFNGLDYLYSNPSRWALAFQTYVQLTMLEVHTAKQSEPVKLMERSIYSARHCFVENLFKSGYLPEIEYVILDRWYNWIIANTDCKLDLIVYLRTRPETAYQRVRERARYEESPVTQEYIEQLHVLHEDWLMNHHSQRPCEVIVIDAERDLKDLQTSYDALKTQITAGFG